MKLAFIGTHGVGKTTLCYELAAALKKRDVSVELVREVARECPLPINRDTTLTAQAWILHSQIAWELAASSRAEVVVCDRAALDNFCYLRRAGDGSAWEQALCELARGWTPTYDFLVKVPIVQRPTFDGVRDTDVAFQQEIEDLISETLAEWRVPRVVSLDAARRDTWSEAVLEAILPVLRPQELLFPDSNGASSQRTLGHGRIVLIRSVAGAERIALIRSVAGAALPGERARVCCWKKSKRARSGSAA